MIFHAPTYKKFREKFFYSNNIKTIIDLPHDTFRLYNNAKCIAIILERNVEQQKEVQLINVEEIGHDHLGKPKYKCDFEKNNCMDEIIDDVPSIISSLENSSNHKLIKYVKSKNLIDRDILVP